jgi:hypothetical protein
MAVAESSQRRVTSSVLRRILKAGTDRMAVAGRAARAVGASLVDSEETMKALPPAGVFKHLAVVFLHNCAIRLDDAVVCWGTNTVGELEASGAPKKREPVVVPRRPASRCGGAFASTSTRRRPTTRAILSLNKAFPQYQPIRNSEITHRPPDNSSGRPELSAVAPTDGQGNVSGGC